MCRKRAAENSPKEPAIHRGNTAGHQ